MHLHSYLSDMAYPYTRSRARSELADSDVEPSDTAPSAATCPLPPSIFVGPNVVAAERPESVSTESAGPVSAPHSLFQREVLSPRAVTVCQGLRVLFKWWSPP